MEKYPNIKCVQTEAQKDKLINQDDKTVREGQCSRSKPSDWAQLRLNCLRHWATCPLGKKSDLKLSLTVKISYTQLEQAKLDIWRVFPLLWRCSSTSYKHISHARSILERAEIFSRT